MRFVIFGGGCYGTFYGRQLLRARQAGADAAEEIRVVDHDPDCRARTELGRAAGLHVDIAPWDDFLDAELPGMDPDVRLVTPPFTPHLALGWLLRRLRREVPEREWSLEAFQAMPGTPFQRQSEGGPLVVSHADWICPVHCIEPETCPATRGPRDWDLDPTVRTLAGTLAAAGQPVDQVHLFHCHHIVYGVGGFPAGDVLSAFEAIRDRAADGGGGMLRFLVGTVSHCHGALHLLRASSGTDREAGVAAASSPPIIPSN